MNKTQLSYVFMILSTLSFACMGVFVRLSGELPLYEKVFFRNFIMLIIISVTIFKSKEATYFGKRENRKLLLLRSFSGLLGVFLFFYAIDNLYLSDSAILNKISPFFVVLFSAILLKNRSKNYVYILMVLAFAGALLIIKPSFDYTFLPALSGFLSALFAGLAYTIISMINDQEKGETIIFYFSFVSVVATLPMFFYSFVFPSPKQLIYLVALGIAATAGQYFLTHAYKIGNAAKISILNYFGLIASMILGYLIFCEVPDWFSILGTILIIIALITMYVKNRGK